MKTNYGGFCELSDIFPTSWGVLEDFRKEAEGAPFGGLEAVKQKALMVKFMDIDELADHLNCSKSVARNDALGAVRIFKDDRRFLYLREDVVTRLSRRPDKVKKSK